MTRGLAPVRRPRILDLQPPTDTLCADVRRGLAGEPRTLPPKYFYDDAGARLFERITTLDEYYPSRTEIGILERHLDEIAAAIGPGARVIEFGSGSGVKTRLLLEGLDHPAAYVPVDIARGQLQQSADALAAAHPNLEILPVCTDYTGPFTPPAGAVTPRRTVAFFPGSTIGNFEEHEAAAFLERVAELCGAGGGLLIGADLHKNTTVLERAYDDAHGVTAAFNLNVLRRINRECGADFDLSAFRHSAPYDEVRRRIEMRLVCRRRTTVTIPADGAGPVLSVSFNPGEHILTEYSHKYTPRAFATLAARSGWRVERLWTDPRRWFSVWLLARENWAAGRAGKSIRKTMDPQTRAWRAP